MSDYTEKIHQLIREINSMVPLGTRGFIGGELPIYEGDLHLIYVLPPEESSLVARWRCRRRTQGPASQLRRLLATERPPRHLRLEFLSFRGFNALMAAAKETYPELFEPEGRLIFHRFL